MTDVVKSEQVQAPTPSSESAALIAMIDRAARDPSVNVEKMERLFQMYAAVDERRAKAEYTAALADMQPELPVIDKRGAIERRAKDDSGVKRAAKATKYAKWEDVVEGIAPILGKHGFAITFRIKQDQRVEVTAVLSHRGGHSESTSMTLPIDDSGAKNNIQGWGSSISYGKRYTAFALLNIAARDEDDDGQAAGNTAVAGPISEAQTEAIRKLLVATATDADAFCEYFRIERVADLRTTDYDRAIAALNKKRGAA